MKKIILCAFILTFISHPAYCSELTEDYFDIAANYAMNGEYTDAIDYLSKILEIEPENNTAIELRNGLTYINEGKTGSYIAGENLAVRHAMEAKKIGSRKKELESLINSVNTNLRDYWSCFFLAEYYRENCDYDNAILYYGRAVRIKPNFTQCYLSMAICDYELRKYENALISINKYLEINTGSDIGYAMRARIELAQNNFAEAEKDIKKAISLNNDISYQFIYGRILFVKGDYKSAKMYFEKLKKDTKIAEVYAYAGYCDYELKNPKSALANLQTAILLSDDDKTLINKYNEIKSEIKE